MRGENEDEILLLKWMRCRLAIAGVQLALLEWRLALKAGFRPEQPRVPAGRPGGGRWTDGDDGGGPVINDPPIEEVYPELLILPLLRIPRLLNAWRLWVLSRREAGDWTLGAHKTPKRWAKQLEERNWTPDDITETIKYGRRYKAPNKVRESADPRATATRYEYNGRYVVRDDQTGEILQVSDTNFIPNELP